MPKLVQLNCHLTVGGTARNSEFTSFNLDLIRAEVESWAMGDRSDAFELGVFQHAITANVRVNADFVFVKQLLTAMEAGTDLAIVYRPKPTASPKATDNPEYAFAVKVARMPPQGGQRGALFGEGALNLKINGAVTYDDGGTPIVLG
jgi:hypothetical protein